MILLAVGCIVAHTAECGHLLHIEYKDDLCRVEGSDKCCITLEETECWCLFHSSELFNFDCYEG